MRLNGCGVAVAPTGIASGLAHARRARPGGRALQAPFPLSRASFPAGLFVAHAAEATPPRPRHLRYLSQGDLRSCTPPRGGQSPKPQAAATSAMHRPTQAICVLPDSEEQTALPPSPKKQPSAFCSSAGGRYWKIRPDRRGVDSTGREVIPLQFFFCVLPLTAPTATLLQRPYRSVS